MIIQRQNDNITDNIFNNWISMKLWISKTIYVMSYIISTDAKPVMKNNVMIAFETLRSQILFISMGEYL